MANVKDVFEAYEVTSQREKQSNEINSGVDDFIKMLRKEMNNKENVPTDIKEDVPTDIKEDVPADNKEDVPADNKEDVQADNKEDVSTDNKEDVLTDSDYVTKGFLKKILTEMINGGVK